MPSNNTLKELYFQIKYIDCNTLQLFTITSNTSSLHHLNYIQLQSDFNHAFEYKLNNKMCFVYSILTHLKKIMLCF